jgi:hypothetical protein
MTIAFMLFMTSQPVSRPTEKLALPIDSLSKMYQDEVTFSYSPKKIGFKESFFTSLC